MGGGGSLSHDTQKQAGMRPPGRTTQEGLVRKESPSTWLMLGRRASMPPNVNGRLSCIVLGVTLGPDLNFPSRSFSEVILPKVNELNLSLSIRWFTTTDTEDRVSPSTGAARRMPRDSFNKRCEN